jgi:hypothetical protein
LVVPLDSGNSRQASAGWVVVDGYDHWRAFVMEDSKTSLLFQSSNVPKNQRDEMDSRKPRLTA